MLEVGAAAPAMQADIVGSLNCLSIDVEEYFHCEAFADVIGRSQWGQLERRAAPCIERIRDLLSRHAQKATFFVLGWTVEYLAPLLRELVTDGHEIACHGDAHQHLARLDPAGLREDLKRARGRIEDRVGVCPRGYRAPTFSVTRQTAWALDIIAAAGFEYDTSVFPIRHDRYGVPDAPTSPFWAVAPSGARVLEFPPLTLDGGLVRFPMGGGGYLRLLPGAWMRQAVRQRVQRGAPVMLYVHPWELDPDQPTPKVGALARWRHRVNLRTTEEKLDRLLREFEFDTAYNVVRQVARQRELVEFRLAP